MTTPRATLCAALVAVCAIGLAACGSSDDSGREHTAAAAISQSLMASQSGGITLTAEQAGCIGTATVKALGVNTAVGDGLLTKDLKPVTSIRWALPPTDADKFADAMISCADPGTAIKNALVTAIKPKTADKTQALRDCLDKALTPALLHSALAASAAGNTADQGLTPLFTACGQVG